VENSRRNIVDLDPGDSNASLVKELMRTDKYIHSGS